MMVSVTEEEVNSTLSKWICQRSRWIKGYYQTWLVHMRHPWRLWWELGPRRFLGFQLTLGLTTVTTLVNPLFWAMTTLYLATGTRYIAALFPGPTIYAGVATMVLGNLLMCYCLMAGCMERRLYRAVLAVLGTPVYWALMSVARTRRSCGCCGRSGATTGSSLCTVWWPRIRTWRRAGAPSRRVRWFRLCSRGM
jgi:cellulose synthase/poly-beta-1,6-N-acetylglucosamine synthase-like glycosyltransferase